MMDTKEQAIKKANEDILYFVHKGKFERLEITENSYIVHSATGENEYSFTLPTPEFENGTIGLDCSGDVCFMCGISELLDHKYITDQNLESVKEGGGDTYSNTFTPIYQNDPVLERAFKTACMRIANYSQTPYDMIRSKLLSESKEALK